MPISWGRVELFSLAVLCRCGRRHCVADQRFYLAAYVAAARLLLASFNASRSYSQLNFLYRAF